MKYAIAVAGMPGAGKGSLSKIAKVNGFRVYNCGDVVREEALNQGETLDRLTLRKLMYTLREKEGPAVIIKRMMSKIDPQDTSPLLVEGVRSLEEVQELKKICPVILFAIHTSPKERYVRLRRRGRSDDPTDQNEFDRRDREELMIGLGNVIALADHMVVNEGGLTEFELTVRDSLRKTKPSLSAL